MDAIYPPIGDQDETRFLSVKREDREYFLFALEFCASIIERRPNHLEALEIAANHFTELGYFADGLRLDQHLVSLRPDDPGILYNHSCSLALTGRVDEALEQLSRAVGKGFRDFRQISTDRDLSAIRSDPRFAGILAQAATNID